MDMKQLKNKCVSLLNERKDPRALCIICLDGSKQIDSEVGAEDMGSLLALIGVIERCKFDLIAQLSALNPVEVYADTSSAYPPLS